MIYGLFEGWLVGFGIGAAGDGFLGQQCVHDLVSEVVGDVSAVWLLVMHFL